MNYYPEFARLLNEELVRQDRTPSWLAQRLGISPSTVTRWLNHGARPGKPETIVRIVDVLGITSRRQEVLVSAGYGYQPGNSEVDEVHASDNAVDADQEDMHAALRIGEPSRGDTEIAESSPPAVRLHTVPAALPMPSTPLVGRDSEISFIADQLADPLLRLLTIIGPGGMGKTRLALAVAKKKQEARHFSHGVAFVALAPLSDVEQIPSALADAVGLHLESGGDHPRSPQQQLFDFLHNRRLLLALDNVEHLLGGVGFVADMLQSATGVQILATSREPLGLPEEQLLPLRGLDYVGNESVTDPGDAPAVALFMQAARRIRPDYAPVAAADADTVAGANTAALAAAADVCQLVEGMPLAIELAASWVTVLPVAEIAAEIRGSLDFLATDLRAVPERHRSMQAVFDATWQRMDDGERETFAQLSIFRGGFRRQAAQQVTGATLRQLRSLAERTLITFNREGDRYAIHELLRQYGAQRLTEDPNLEKRARDGHSSYYSALLRQYQDALIGKEQQAALAVLDDEHDNLGAAWHWAASQGHVQTLAQTMDGLGIYYQLHVRFVAGESIFGIAAETLDRSNEYQLLARALTWQATFTRMLERFAPAGRLLERSFAILDGSTLAGQDTRSERAFALLQRSALVFSRDNQTALRYCEQSCALFEELDDYWWTAEALLRLGDIIFALGDYAQHQAYIERALELYKKAGNERGIAVALSLLGDSNNSQGRPEAALRLGQESLAVFRALDDSMGIGLCLRRIGSAKIHLGKSGEARQDLLESAALFAEIGARRDESIAYIVLAHAWLVQGNYARGGMYAQKALDIVQNLEDQVLTALSLSVLGTSMQNGGALQEALLLHREAVAISERMVGSSDLAHEYAALGLAESQTGLGKLARVHCFKGLRLAVQYASWWEGLRVLSICMVILADGENPERAVELLGVLRSDPYFTYSAWLEDEIGKPMRAVMETLPADVVARALERGKHLELWETATALLDELRTLGWDEETA